MILESCFLDDVEVLEQLVADVQAPALMKHLEEKMGLMLVRICSLIFMVVFILHIFACCFHYVALLDENSESWVEASGIVDPSSISDRCDPARCRIVAQRRLCVTFAAV